MKTETYTVLEYNELHDLVREHLGVTVDETRYRRYDDGDDWDAGIWTGIQQELELGNDTNWIYDPRERRWGPNNEYGSGWKAELEDIQKHGDDFNFKTVKYIAQLCEKGVLSDEHPIMVRVWW